MNKEKISKVHYWIRQLRRPLCMIMVFVIVLSYGFISNAEQVLETFNERYNNSSTSLPGWSYNTMKTVWGENGGDITKINYSGNYYGGSRLNLNTQIFNNENAKVSKILTVDGVNIDLSDKYISLPQNSSNNYIVFQFYFIGNGRFALVDNYYVSDESFRILYVTQNVQTGDFTYNDTNHWFDSTQISGTNLFGFRIDNYNGYGLQFTDLDVYMSTSDGSSGFTGFSDFSFDGDNYNFNYFKTQDYIVSPADPEPIPDGNGIVEYAKSRMNFSMTSEYIGGTNVKNAKHRLHINFPVALKSNPEIFQVRGNYTAVLDVDGMGSYTYEYNRSFVLSGPKAVNMTYIDAPIDFTGFYRTDGSGRTLWQDFLLYAHQVLGTSEQIIDENEFWHNLFDAVESGTWLGSGPGTNYTSDRLAYIKPEFGSIVNAFKIKGDIWLSLITNDGSYDTGHNVTDHDFITGDYDVISSDNTVNFYPIEGQDPYQLPSTGNGSGIMGGSNNYGGAVAYGGQGGQGGTVIVNPEQVPYTMDMGEYGSMADLFIAIRDSLQYGSGDSNVVTAGNDKVNNNFMYLIEGVYGMLPPNIWHLITISISIISGVAVVKFVRNKH